MRIFRESGYKRKKWRHRKVPPRVWGGVQERGEGSYPPDLTPTQCGFRPTRTLIQIKRAKKIACSRNGRQTRQRFLLAQGSQRGVDPRAGGTAGQCSTQRLC